MRNFYITTEIFGEGWEGRGKGRKERKGRKGRKGRKEGEGFLKRTNSWRCLVKARTNAKK